MPDKERPPSVCASTVKTTGGVAVDGSAVNLLPSERKMHYLFSDQLAPDKNTLSAHWRRAEQLFASML